MQKPLAQSDQTVTVPADLSGYQLLSDARLNKGTAFTEAERDAFGLHGLLPPTVMGIDEQVSRRLQAFRGFATDLERYAFLRDLQDTNETLFYALLAQNIEELLPIVYTPTVGAGCASFSRLFRKPRGLFLSLPHRDARSGRSSAIRNSTRPRSSSSPTASASSASATRAPAAWASPSASSRSIPPAAASIRRPRCRCCSTSAPTTPRISPIRSISAGGTSACAGADYDDFVEEFVAAVNERWPHVLLQWEDFAKANATRLLDAIATGSAPSTTTSRAPRRWRPARCSPPINITGVPLTEQRIVILGAGSAGSGIAQLLLRRHGRCRARRQDGGAALLSGRPRRAAGRGHGGDAVPAALRCSRARRSPIGRSAATTASRCSTSSSTPSRRR